MAIPEWQQRTALLLGENNLRKLADSTVAVVGLGGVGGAAAEALCRAGVGHLVLLDCDTVSESNRNRQLFATTQTVGQHKCDAAAARLQTVNPDCNLTLLKLRLEEQTIGRLLEERPAVVIDAIDTVTSKLQLASACAQQGLPLLMCLGTGNRTDPGKLRLGTIAETAGCGCPLARVLRRELKRRGITSQKVVFSTEPPLHTTTGPENGRHPPASSPFCPPVAGYLLAAEAVRLLTTPG